MTGYQKNTSLVLYFLFISLLRVLAYQWLTYEKMSNFAQNVYKYVITKISSYILLFYNHTFSRGCNKSLYHIHVKWESLINKYDYGLIPNSLAHTSSGQKIYKLLHNNITLKHTYNKCAKKKDTSIFITILHSSTLTTNARRKKIQVYS